jgi:lysophospholipase L1-like esterase
MGARMSQVGRFGWMAVTASALAGMLVAAAGVPGAAARIAAPAKAVMQILVMGDSYSAGNGAGDYSGAKGCYRSGKDYAQEFAAIIRAKPYSQPAAVTDVACSGAVTADFFNSRSGRPPETSAVSGNYDLIFLTIGGNDADFADIVKYCLIAETRDGANCNPLLGNAERLIADGTMRTRITNVLTSIRAKASPGAKIVLLGYPFLEGDTSYTLRSGHGDKSPIIKVGQRLHAIGVAADGLDQSIVNSLNAAALGSPFAFVSVHKLFDGPPYHGLYAKKNNPNRWMVQPFVDASPATYKTWYHPNPTGWRQEGQLLASTGSVPKKPFSWSAASTAVPSGGSAPYLTAIACPSVTDCAAVGSYQNASGTFQGLFVTGSGTVWKASAIPLPAGADRARGSRLLSVTCPSTAACVAVGYYTDGSGNTHGLLVTRSGSSLRARAAPLPRNAVAHGQEAALNAVACPSAVRCFAAGTYIHTASGFDAGLLLSASGAPAAAGTSWTADESPLPADWGGWAVNIFAIACPAANWCAVPVSYWDTAGNSRLAFVTGSGRAWRAAGAPVPANLTPDDGSGDQCQEAGLFCWGNNGPLLFSMSCVAKSSCVAAGSYDSTSGEEGIVVSESGSAIRTVPIAVAAGAVSFDGLEPVVCPSAANCLTVGAYQTLKDKDVPPLIATGHGGTWHKASAPIPSDGATPSGAILNSVACATPARCVAVGNYFQRSSDEQGFLVLGSGSAWTAVQVPVNAAAGNELDSVTCLPTGTCVAAGQTGNDILLVTGPAGSP